MPRREGKILHIKRWPIFHRIETALRKRARQRGWEEKKYVAEDNIRRLEETLENNRVQLENVLSNLESAENDPTDWPDRDDLIEALERMAWTISARITHYEKGVATRRNDLKIIEQELSIGTGTETGAIVPFPVKKRRRRNDL